MINEDYIAEAKNVVKIYGKNKAEAAKMMEAGLDKDEVYRKTGAAVALWDVSFKVRRTEIFVIIGLSGSGKSTIIRCFNQLLKLIESFERKIDTFLSRPCIFGAINKDTNVNIRKTNIVILSAHREDKLCGFVELKFLLLNAVHVLIWVLLAHFFLPRFRFGRGRNFHLWLFLQ